MTTRPALSVVVVGRSPEKMNSATAVLRSAGFATIAAFSEEQAHLAIAARDGLFAIVTGGAIDQPARERLRTAAAQKGAVLVTAHIANDDPAAHFANHVLPKLIEARDATGHA
jgi:hypothetical protein